MTDLASLGVRVDSSEVPAGVERLDALADAGGRAETSVNKLAAETRKAMGATTGATSSLAQMGAQVREADAQMRRATSGAGGLSAAETKLAEETKKTTLAFADFVGHDFAAQYQRVTAAALNHAGAQTRLAGATKLSSAQLTNLSFQLNDVVTGLASGQRPLQILAQQGGQVFQALQQGSGGALGSLRALLGMVNPVTAGIGLMAGAALAFGVAGFKAAQSARDMEAATYGLGRATGLTGEQLQSLADNTARTADLSQAAAEKMVVSYVRMGLASSDVLTRATNLTRDYARATGEDLKDAQKELGQALADPIAGIDTLTQSIGGVDGATKEYILRLAREGELDKARAEMLGIIARQTGNAADQVDGLSKSLHGAGNAWSNFWKAAGQGSLNFFSPPAAGKSVTSRSFGYNPAADTTDRAAASAKATSAQNASQANLNQLTRQAADAYKALAPHEEQINKLRADQVVLNKLLAAGDGALAKAGLDRTKVNKALADSEKKIKDLGLTDEQKKAKSAAESAAKSSDNRAASLAREAAAMEVTIKGALGLASAYSVSATEGLRAEATAKATAAALTKRGDIDAFVSRQIRLVAAEQAAAGAKSLDSITADTAARERLNDQVQAGILTSSEAASLLRDEGSLRPLITAAALAEGNAKEVLAGVIEKLRFGQARLNDQVEREQNIARARNDNNQIAMLQAELGLITATNRERAVKLAVLAKTLELEGRHAGDSKTFSGGLEIGRAAQNAGLTEDLRTGQDNYNASLAYTSELLAQIDAQARDAAGGLAAAFQGAGTAIERVGKGVGDLTTVLSAYASKQAQIEERRKERSLAAGKDAVALARIETVAASDSAHARLEAYGEMASAGRSFFQENTVAYKALQAAEIAFRAIELVGSIRSVAQKGVEVAAHVAAEGTKATASGITAYAVTLASLPFPFNLAAGAAVLASLAAIGVAISGRGGGASSINVAEDRQKRQGTGSVLGDASAKSDSIAKSLGLISKNSFEDLQYSNAMLRSLQSIDNQIGTVASALARSLSVGGSLSTDGLGLGSTTKQGGLVSRGVGAVGGAALGGIAGAAVINGALGLGLSGAIGAGLAGLGVQIGSLLGPIGAIAGAVLGPLLFNSKTTVSLLDQGIRFDPQTLGQITANGVSGSSYQDVQSTTKNSFLGIGIGSKSKTSTVTGDLDADFTKQVSLLFTSLRAGVLDAASILGVEGAAALVDAVNLDLGKISFKDLKPDEIEAALNAVFSKAADDLAGAAIPALAELQKAGEGAFETLTRVANDYQVLDLSLKAIGKTFGATGLASLSAREDLIALAGGLDQLVDSTKAYSQAILTEDQQMRPVLQAVAAELERLGLTGLKTRAQFAAVVDGLDLTTAAGRAEYAALLALAPAFAKVIDYTAALTGVANDNISLTDQLSAARSTLSDAYDRESSALVETRDKMLGFVDSLTKFRKGLDSGPAAQLSPENAYLAAQSQFNQVSSRIRAGDTSAVAEFQDVAAAFQEASLNYNATSAKYFQDLAAIKSATDAASNYAQSQANSADQQLAELAKMVEGQIGVKAATNSVVEQLKIIADLLKQAGQATGGGGAGSSFDAGTYGADNPDLTAAYSAYAAGSNPFGFAAGLDQAGFLKAHYDRTGQYEIAQGLRKFAKGTDSAPGGMSWVGEEGPEIMNVPRGAQIIPNSILRKGGDNAAVEAKLDRLITAIDGLRNQLQAANTQRGAATMAITGKLDAVAEETAAVKKAITRAKAA